MNGSRRPARIRCVAIAWKQTTLTDEAIAVGVVLGIDEAQLRGKQQRHGAVEDRYAAGKVLFTRDDDET
jgi:hypothetical protein